MAEGNLESPVDTKHMFYDFKTIGECINSTGAGLEIAVNERMKSERFKTELISNVSHDIKTPLTSIISYVELLKEQPAGEPANPEYLETLERQSVKLKKLLEDLIEASKASTGNLKAELEPCNVNTVLYQVIGEYEEKLSASQLDLRVNVPEEPISIMADTKHLQRVLDNLFINVSKYSQPGTRVYVNLSAGSDETAIEIKNTSKEPLNMTTDELLERFARGDSSRGSEGNGLGLSIAQSLMELMNGKLKLVVDGDLFKVILLFPRITE
jgi:signal transduction histidine kinase